jgi:hypothetical protein
MDIDPNIDYDSVVVLDASIPKSNYVINSKNNSFVVTEEGIDRTITLEVGNYNRTSLKNVLKTLLNGTYTYDITFNNSNRVGDDGKYTFTCVEINPTFTFATGMYEQLGFEKNTSYTFTDNALKSVCITNFRPEAVYYILSNLCQNRNNTVLSNIISTTTNDFNYINYQCVNPNEYSKDFARTKSNSYYFIITDEDFNEISLNGLNVVFTVMLYKRNNIDSLIKGYIKAMTITSLK